jgi:hypothetical protein
MSISRAAPLRRPDARLLVRLAARRVLLPRDERAPRPPRFALPRRVLVLARLPVRPRLDMPRVFRRPARPVLLPLLLRPILRLAICSSFRYRRCPGAARRRIRARPARARSPSKKCKRGATRDHATLRGRAALAADGYLPKLLERLDPAA